MCSYGQLSEIQMLRDLDLGSGQGHINIYSMCTTSSMPVLQQHHALPKYSHLNFVKYRHRSLNSHDSFSRRKFKNQAPKSCSPGPILSPSTISFELHAKTAEEIDVEKCNFCNFDSSVTLTLTLDQVEVTLVRIRGRVLPTYQIRWKSEKLFVDVHTDRRADTSVPIYQVIVGDDLKTGKQSAYWFTAK